jgi:S1-C subfamily serine protease
MATTRNSVRVGALLGSVVVAAVVGGAAGAATAHLFPPTVQVSVPLSATRPGPAVVNGVSIPSIVQRVLPEVVSIDATGDLLGVGNGAPFGIGGSSPGEEFKSAGTGMIVSKGGLVLTNNHVIAGATSVAVTLDGTHTALPATIVGTIPSLDLALLRIDHPPANLEPVTFGDSRALVPGDAVIAIGNALGLQAGSPTVTSGIVSALGRVVSATIPTTGQTETLDNMIQTDAAINPGNSGGPLVDSAGDVVGMNTAAAGTTSDGTQAENIGFAIPSSELVAELPVLERGGSSGAPGAFLGVEVEDDSSTLASEFGLPVSSGAVVVEVLPGTPAQRAGLEPGDVIVGFGGQSVSSAGALGAIEQHYRPGQQVAITFWAGSSEKTATVTLATRPAS